MESVVILYSTCKFSSYCTENTFYFRFKDQAVSAVQENNTRCGTMRSFLILQNLVLIHVLTTGL